jgi:CheY-like chemotaxis protein
LPDGLRTNPETILVVDDNESVLQIVVAILQHAGFGVLSADNGVSAMKLAENMDTKD